MFIEASGANEVITVDDTPTFEEWFIHNDFANENAKVSDDCKAYIDDLVRKTNLIPKWNYYLNHVLVLFQTLDMPFSLVNTLNEIFSIDTEPNEDPLKKEDNKIDIIMEMFNANITETRIIDGLISNNSKIKTKTEMDSVELEEKRM